MPLSKRRFLELSASASLLAAAAPLHGAAEPARPAVGAPGALVNMAADAAPISVAETIGRIAKAQRLMREHDIDAVVLEPGSAMIYFTGVRWYRSERYVGVVIPREGDIAFVTPYFEEPSVRESMRFGDDVRTWHEHENPFALVAGILADRGLRDGRVGIEETVRFFIADGIAAAAPRFEIVSADAVTRGCRMFKSPAELALMQLANSITLKAYRHTYRQVEGGMTGADIKAIMNSATRALGGDPKFASVLLNESSAYPHGSKAPQVVEEGGVVLMDCGCAVHDYRSDISRTWVHGEPNERQRRVWKTAKRGQEIALETAQIGTPAGRVDDAVRAYYAREGFGPDYQTPGLSHRLGHGIGIDVHEPINFVRGEDTPLAPGMCLSNEPGIYWFGEFGVRLEDCMMITEDGPRMFTPFSPSIDAPFG